jgi:hypothetical protein
MVKTIHTFVAQIAVTTPRGPDYHTVRAQTAWFNLVNQLHEIQTFILLQDTWI